MRKDFVHLVYSVDEMAGNETRATEKRIASALAKKWRQPYSQMVQYVKMRMNIAIIRFREIKRTTLARSVQKSHTTENDMCLS